MPPPPPPPPESAAATAARCPRQPHEPSAAPSLVGAVVERSPAGLALRGEEDVGGAAAPSPPPASDAGGAASPAQPSLLSVGAFQQLPAVSPANEILGTALRRAKLIRPTKGAPSSSICSPRPELAGPLGVYITKFPSPRRLHAFERCLLELTLGDGNYQLSLSKVDALRKRVLDLGKNYALLVNKTTTRKEAEDVAAEGFMRLEELFKRFSPAVDGLKEVAKTLRAMPVVHTKVPTLCLVGAPNVGKSSLVRVLSSGKPEVCNYPFTTRGISMGHFFVDTRRHQVTDTPGLLHRPDAERNNIEKLTLAALCHLPTAVLYVHDLTGDCGMSTADQYFLHLSLKERFAERPWIDVVSKSDLLPQPRPEDTMAANLGDSMEAYHQQGPLGALYVSTETGNGLIELKQRVVELLSASRLWEEYADVPDDEVNIRQLQTVAKKAVEKAARKKEQEDFYFPALPEGMLRGTYSGSRGALQASGTEDNARSPTLQQDGVARKPRVVRHWR
eukprot:SM000014S00405  [mRNA]  locus=s14:1097337:1105903:- [translate_table: standard]